MIWCFVEGCGRVWNNCARWERFQAGCGPALGSVALFSAEDVLGRSTWEDGARHRLRQQRLSGQARQVRGGCPGFPHPSGGASSLALFFAEVALGCSTAGQRSTQATLTAARLAREGGCLAAALASLAPQPALGSPTWQSPQQGTLTLARAGRSRSFLPRWHLAVQTCNALDYVSSGSGLARSPPCPRQARGRCFAAGHEYASRSPRSAWSSAQRLRGLSCPPDMVAW
jgi:hypothetical protein